MNGLRVGDHVLAPGWTSYTHRLRYQTYDVSALVREGANELEVLLGNGWFRGRLGWRERRALYGDRLALLAQLEVTTGDGAVHVLASDGSWTAYEAACSPTTCTTASGPTSGTCAASARTAPTSSTRSLEGLSPRRGRRCG